MYLSKARHFTFNQTQYSMHIGDKLTIELITTEDGSPSLYLPHLQETYHSRHGAVREAMHVFIQNGFRHVALQFSAVEILEVGFGTGLNALLTCHESTLTKQQVRYTTIEKFPLNKEVYEAIHYGTDRELYLELHQTEWEKDVLIHNHFTLQKTHNTLEKFESKHTFNLVYYDAFGPPAQPEMWTPELFKKIYDMMAAGGVLVTYCAKGQVRRDLQSCGFLVERLPGPPGKREMLRATKP